MTGALGIFLCEFCHLETTKVLKFPKLFGYFVEMEYLCTVFAIEVLHYTKVELSISTALSYVYVTYMLRISYVYGT